MLDSNPFGGLRLGASELFVPQGLLIHFFLVLTRIGGLFAFVSVPGLKSALAPTRIGLVLLITVLVFPFTHGATAIPATLGGAAKLMLSELGLGLVFGLSIQFLHEGVLLGAQTLSVQAGYSYASTIDPTSEADSSVLQVFLGLGSSLLFLTLGFDRLLIKLIAQSLETIPPGSLAVTAATAPSIIHLASGIFVQGIRVAAPIVGMLLLVDVAMALLSRLQPQLQLLSLSFPLKMLLTLVGLAFSIQTIPLIVRSSGETTFSYLDQFVRSGGR
jgi:flagellar biosynthesis protein FliR